MALFRFPKRRLRKMIQRGEYEEAVEFGRGLGGQFAGDADYMSIMGGLFYILEDDREALSYLEKAEQLGESGTDMLEVMTNVHLRLGHRKEALECCRRILEEDPENLEAQRIAGSLDQ